MSSFFHKSISIVLTSILVFASFQLPLSVKAETSNDYSIEISDVFHDQSDIYFSNIEPTSTENVTVKIRCKKNNVSSVKLQYSINNGSSWNSVDMIKNGLDKTGYYEYFKCVLPAISNTYFYRFYLSNNVQNVYYSAYGKTSTAPIYTHCFSVIPNFSTPDWAKGAFWYFINPDGFYNGDTQNDLVNTGGTKTATWNESVSSLLEHYGGDIKGVEKKTDYLKALGVNAIYLNPIWSSRQSLAYGPSSFYKISPYLGNDDDLISLINSLHDNNIKISLDAVLSYVSTNNIWFNQYDFNPLDGAFQSITNKYVQMFSFNEYPDDFKIKWGGAQLNYANSLTKQLVYASENSFIKRYLKPPYNIDGWRFDATTSFDTGEQDINSFFGEIRDAIKTENKNALMISEDCVYSYLLSGKWDGSYCKRGYLRQWFNGEYEQSEIATLFNEYLAYPRSEVLCSFNLFDLHDESRITSDSYQDFSKLKALALLQMTYIGSPTIYYGDEVGVTDNANDGKSSQKYNSFNWDQSEWNMPLYDLYCKLGNARKDFSVLKTGAVKIGEYDDTAKFLSFGRFDDNSSIITLLNQTNDLMTKTIDVKQYNVCDGEKLTDYFDGSVYTVVNGKVTVSIPNGGTMLTNTALKAHNNSIYLNSSNNDSKVYATDFSDINESSFLISGSANIKYNKLSITGKSAVLSRIPQNDYTIKSKIGVNSLQDGKMIAIVDLLSENEFVFAGRKNINNNRYLVFGKRVNGKDVIYNKIADTLPDEDCTIVLQKCGTNYSAVYSYDDCYKLLGENLITNYSYSNSGIYSDDNVNAIAEYISFGNYINDRSSVNTPRYTENIDCGFDNYESYNTRQNIEVIGNKSDWEYTNGGISRISGTDISQLAISNRTYSDFRVNVTLKPIDDGAACGITFLRSTVISTLAGAYVLKLTKSGELSLYKDSNTFVTVHTDIPENGLQIIVERIGNNLFVYSGNEHNLICELNNISTENGYITFFSVGGKAGIFNDSINSLNTNWVDVTNDYSYSSYINTITSKSNGLSLSNYNKFGLSDIYISSVITLSPDDTSQNAFQGFAICGKSGSLLSVSNAISVLLNSNGTITLEKNGIVLKEANIGKTSAFITVIKKKNKINVWVDGVLIPVLTYKTNNLNGGTFGLVSNNSFGTFKNLSVKDMTDSDYEPIFDETKQTMLYQNDSQTLTADTESKVINSITKDKYFATLNYQTSSKYFEIKYRENNNGDYLALRFLKSYLYLYQNGAIVSTYKYEELNFPSNFSIANNNKYTFSFDESKICIWINGMPITSLSRDKIYNSLNTQKTLSVFSKIESGKSAQIKDFSVWQNTFDCATTFIDESGENIETVYSQKGEDITSKVPYYIAPQGSFFLGWSSLLNNIQSDETIYPIIHKTDEPVFDFRKNADYIENTYNGYKVYSKTDLPLTVDSNNNCSYSFPTGLGKNKSYYLTTTISDVTADCFHIQYRTGTSSSIALRIYKNQMVAINKDGKTQYTSWPQFANSGIGNLDLLKPNRVTLFVEDNSLSVWINGKFISKMTYNDNYSASVFNDSIVGIYLYSGKSAKIHDIKVYTDLNDGLRPVYSSFTDNVVKSVDSISLGNTSTKKTSEIFTLNQDIEEFLVSFSVKSDAQFIEIPFAKNASQTLNFRLYRTQCLIISSTGKVYSNWAQLAPSSLSYINSIWGQKFYVDMRVLNENILVFINGQLITTLNYETQPSDFTEGLLAFASYMGTYTDITDIKIYCKSNNKLTSFIIDGIKYDSSNEVDVTLPSIPHKSGYYIVGWQYSSDNKTYYPHSIVTIENNGIFTAKYGLIADLDSNGTINAEDCIIMIKILLGYESIVPFNAIDANEDGYFDIRDFVRIKKIIVYTCI